MRGFALLVMVMAGVAVAEGGSREDLREAAVLRALFQGIGNMACGEVAHKALAEDDRPVAVREIARHFRSRPLAPGYAEKPTACDFETANRAVTGDVTVVGIPWAFKDGRIDWFFNPTGRNGLAPNDEWHLQLNRMSFWTAMADAYALTGDERYARAFREQLRGWIATTEPHGNGGYVTWRTLEAGLRLVSWPYVFERFRRSPSLSDEDLCLMLGSLVEHLRHVMAHRSGGNNWLLIQMNGIYTCASLFPEFGESGMYRREAARILAEELGRQVLPDGYQHELSPDYHACAWGGFSAAYRLGKLCGHLDELPPDYGRNLERLADAMLNLATPCLTEPRCNDCFTIPVARFMRDAVTFFPERADFRWALSGRREGAAPKGETASRILPWSGYAALRSDWGPDATYLFFDFGPLSAGHSHQDKLNIVMFKGGEELVFDDGGGQYENSAFRRHAVSGRGHNTLLVDGCPQQRTEPRVMKEPVDAGWVSTPEHDFVRGAYDQGYAGGGKAVTQTREIRFDKRSDVFTVTDTIEAKDGRTHDYDLLFQLDTTNAVVTADGRGVRADYGPGRKWALEMSFAGADAVTPVSARLEPTLAGWFVGRNDNSIHPATTVFVTARSRKDHRFVTTLRAVPASERRRTR